MSITAKTGWTEDFIRWELPLGRAYAYAHTAAVIEGVNTHWPWQADLTDQWIHSLRQWAQRASITCVPSVLSVPFSHTSLTPPSR